MLDKSLSFSRESSLARGWRILGGMRRRVAKLRRSVANSIFETPGSSKGGSSRPLESPVVYRASARLHAGTCSYVPEDRMQSSLDVNIIGYAL